MEDQKSDPIYAKVIYNKAPLYNDTHSEESNGMYVIKGDRVEILDVVDNGRIWIRFRGKKIIKKYMDASDIKVIDVKSVEQEYLYKHPVGAYDEKGNWTIEEINDILVLKKLKPNLYQYELSTLAMNAHMCEFKGFAKKIDGVLIAQEKGNCTIEFHQKDMAVTIRDVDRHCKAFDCGTNAYIDGIIFLHKNYCELHDFRQYADKLNKIKIESVDKLKSIYKKTATGQSLKCRSLLFSDFRHYYYKFMLAYHESVENDLSEKYLISPKEEKKYKALLSQVGWDLYESEGGDYIGEDAEWFLREFGTFLPDEWKIFLAQREDEVQNKFSEDAALTISWEQLRKRIIFWEEFLNNYPDFPEKSIAVEYLSLYLSAYLTGLDNSPIYDWDTNRLNDETKKSYENFLKLNQKSKYYKIVEGQYKMIKDNNFTVDEKLSQILNDYYLKNNIEPMQDIQPPAY